jgi:hypothetical protein
MTVASKEIDYPRGITEQASVITPQNVSVKPQILAVYNDYLQSSFDCSRNRSQRVLL